MLKLKTRTQHRIPITANLTEIQELNRLKREIVSTHETVMILVKTTKDKARQALAEALLCGGKLNHTKEILKRGQFLQWLEKECTMSQRTAYGYMGLAKLPHVATQLTTGLGLRRAYIALGIIREDDDDATTATEETQTSTPTETKAQGK
jgi:hypothetical protein